jgi:type II secretory pathway pseudopilin PulG
MHTTDGTRDARRGEAGFTLIEALIAIVVLVFGIIAVTNLLVVAAASNSIANASTVATNQAVEALEELKATPYDGPALAAGGDLDANVSAGGVDYFVENNVPGVGRVTTRWVVQDITARIKAIRVRSQTESRLGRPGRAEFTTMRGCSAADLGC